MLKAAHEAEMLIENEEGLARTFKLCSWELGWILQNIGVCNTKMFSTWQTKLAARLQNPSLLHLNEYKYVPLEKNTFTRVIDLNLPDTWSRDSSIRCKLKIVDLAGEHAEYTAISYAWGDTDPSIRIPIECDGCRVMITPTLHSALQRIRYVKKTLFVWADALCINQNEDDQALRERSSQVMMMGRIYSKASEVIVDLGSGSADSIIFEGLNRYVQYDDASWGAAATISNSRVHRTAWNDYLGDRNTIYQDFDLPKRRDLFWPALCYLGERPWFDRLWILQEFALASSVRVIFSNFITDDITLFRGIARAIEHFNYIVSLHTDMASAPIQNNWLWLPFSAARRSLVGSKRRLQLRGLEQKIHLLFNIRSCKWAASKDEWEAQTGSPDILRFHRLLFDSMGLKASDPRDYLYGLLSLISDEDTSMLYVDYMQSPAEVSIRASLYLIQQGFAWSALSHGAGVNCEDQPSWSVKLAETFERTKLWQRVATDDRNCFNAGGKTRIEMPFTQNTSTLSIRAILLGSVSSQTERFPTWIDARDMQLSWESLKGLGIGMASLNSHLVAWIQDARALWIHSVGTSAVHDQSFELLCWRTMCSDISRTGAESYLRLDDLPNNEVLLRLNEYATARPGRARDQCWPLLSAIELLGSMFDRRLGLTSTGPCHIPKEAQVGDEIAVLLGCPIPFLLRKAGHNAYQLVGSCYVHGMMDGQALTRPECPVQDIILS